MKAGFSHCLDRRSSYGSPISGVSRRHLKPALLETAAAGRLGQGCPAGGNCQSAPFAWASSSSGGHSLPLFLSPCSPQTA